MAGERVAVVIGCSSYADTGIPPLKYAETDARALHELLIDPERGGYAPERSLLLCASDHTKISGALFKVLKEARPSDNILLFYAGHGLRDPDTGELFLAAQNTQKDIAPATAVNTRDLKEWIDRCRSKHCCLILDCCFSGAFGTGGRAAESALTASEVTQSLAILSGEGRIILSSAQANQEARERDDYGHGVFTYHMLQGLDGAADVDDDGYVTPQELYQYISRQMAQELGLRQRPQIEAREAGGTFPLISNPEKKRRLLKDFSEQLRTLKVSREHLRALKELETPPASLSETDIATLKNEIRQDMDRLREEYRNRLADEFRDRTIGASTLQEISSLLSENPDFLFSRQQPDKRRRFIRQHFVGDLKGRGLQESWDASIPGVRSGPPVAEEKVRKPPPESKPPSPPENGSTSAKKSPPVPHASPLRVKLLAWSLFTAAAAGVLLYLFFYGPFHESFDPREINVGLHLDKSWSKDEAQATLASFLENFNANIEERDLTLKPAPIYQTLDELIGALAAGDVLVAGELSPVGIWRAERDADAEPFVSAQYGDTNTYSAVVFVRQETGPQRSNARQWEDLLERLRTSDVKIAVSEEDSTSGYWYPRSEVLSRLAGTKGFKQVAVSCPTYDEIFQQVRQGNAVAGVIASFRFDEVCGSRCDMSVIHKIDKIPNGAFVIGRRLREWLRKQNRYEGFITLFGQELSAERHTKSWFPKAPWARAGPDDYKASIAVIETRDPIADTGSRKLRLILIASSVIVVLVLGVYLFMKRRELVPPNVGAQQQTG